MHQDLAVGVLTLIAFLFPVLLIAVRLYPGEAVDETTGGSIMVNIPQIAFVVRFTEAIAALSFVAAVFTIASLIFELGLGSLISWAPILTGVALLLFMAIFCGIKKEYRIEFGHVI